MAQRVPLTAIMISEPLYDCVIDGYPVEYAVEHTKMMVAGLDS